MEENDANLHDGASDDDPIVILDEDRAHNSWLTNGKHVFTEKGLQKQLTPAQMKQRLMSSRTSKWRNQWEDLRWCKEEQSPDCECWEISLNHGSLSEEEEGVTRAIW